MKKFVLICFCVLSSVGGYAQNWDINTLHKINSLDSKFARNYSKAFSKSAPLYCGRCTGGDGCICRYR